MTWHRQAERSGVVHAILHGSASQHAYALFLRNLLPAYQQLEAALDQHRDSAGVCHVARPEIYRSAAIASDLHALCGSRWRATLPLLGPAQDYADHIARAGAGSGIGLIGHAYVRYLGDLNGGRIIRRCLMRSLGLGRESLNFYAFPDIQALERFKSAYRAGFDHAGREISDHPSVISEAVLAFQLNIAVSAAVDSQARGGQESAR